MESFSGGAEHQQLDFMQRVGRVGYWEYDPAAESFWLPALSLKLLESIADIPGLHPGSWIEVLPDGERRRFHSALDAAVKQGLSLHQELSLKHGQGAKASISVRGAPLAAEGQATRYAGTFHDISSEKRAEEEREDVISQFNALLESLRVGVTVFDQDLRLMFWNEQIYNILGLPRAAVYKFASFEELIRYPARRGEYGPGDPEELVRQRVALARRFEPHRFERQARDGRVLLVEGYPFVLGGNQSGFVTTYTDITEQKGNEEKLQRQNHVLSTIIENFPGAVSVFGADLRLVASNDQFKELLELPNVLFDKPELYFEDLIRYNANRGEYGPGDPEQQVAEIVARARNFQPHSIERVRPNGMALEIRGMPLPDGGFVTIYIDITERKQMEDQVHQMAFYDTLTRLPNRRLLDDRLSQSMAASKRSACYGALMFLDLDNFKPLNDLHGHAVGDLLLIEAAERLRACVREVDTVARFGGDEFVVMIGDLDADKNESMAQARLIAEKIRVTLSAPYLLTIRHEGKAETRVEHHCTASIGVALFINHEASQDDILKWADSAMYEAKEAGRNLVRFYEAKPA
ncbi:MAG: PAS-domain containing protein [Propionivibrio sp.]|uniref:PAS-domain containing protein n=1 Tax=Candidatus Propionivibrio dominans TaxID=2954373 RepID=A0A9D7II37_9RHOO|nr:PAS-domain containing protein [Candidatus Propionivibrio dominans]